MNFASLLKNHEIRPLNSASKLMVNCNSKSNHKNLVIQNVHSGFKRFNNSMVGQSLKQIFQKFEQDQTVQWILQLENMRIKLHKFKPSKIKNKKQQLQQSCKTQQNSQQKSTLTKQLPQRKTKQNQSQSKRNYSPLHAKLQSNFTKQQNWNQNPNKFSFGDDQSFRIQQNQQQIQDNKQYHTNQQQDKLTQKGINLFQQFSNQVGQIQSEQTTNYTKVKLNQQHNYIPNYAQQVKQINDPPKKFQQKRIFNQLAQNQSQNLQNIVKISQANPDSLIDFNFDIGMSFQEINKIPLQNKLASNKKMINTLSPKAEQNTIEKNTKMNENSKAICEIDEFVIAPLVSVVQKASQVTSIKVLPSPIVSQPYQIPYPQNTSSPNKIVCKAVVRNLTPQKFKYRRIQPKTQVQINGFNIQQDNIIQGNIKRNQAKNTENQEKPNHNQGNMLIKQLIQQSDKLMQQRANKLINYDDKIKRIVLHQAPAPQQNQTQLLKQTPVQQQSIPIVAVHSPPQDQKTQKQNNQNNQKVNQIKVNSFSPCSPVQQKPKFHNQLAHIDTTYTNERKPLKQLSSNPLAQENIGVPNPTQFPSQYACKPIVPSVTYINSNHQVNQQQPQVIPTTTKTYIPYFPLNNFKTQTNQQNGEVLRPLSYQPYNHVIGNQAQPMVNHNANNRANDFIKINTNYTSPLQNYQSPSQNYTNNQLNYQNNQLNYPNNQVNYPNNQQNYQINQQHYQSSQQNYQNSQQNYQSPIINYQIPVLNCPITLPVQAEQRQQKKTSLLEGIDGIRYVQSRIYQANSSNRVFPPDPKQSSIQFSLRIDEHFAPDNYLKH